ncbi:MAG TPA: hypothetical protein DCL21_04485, partial [Alphaproteobacteria bacterium]|nr:hypothetical protein [Alphaproteobacteria bacterium]
GAMFGLDARIALAIFGALSVISGAALYSAIQQSRVVQIVTESNEIIKAVEQYMLDVGENLADDPHAPAAVLAIGELLTSSNSGWRGPYLPYDSSSLDISGFDMLNDPTGSISLLQVLKKGRDTWGAGVTGSCEGANPCVYTISFSANPAHLAGFMKAVDIYVDGADDDSNGNVRIRNNHLYFLGPKMM